MSATTAAENGSSPAPPGPPSADDLYNDLLAQVPRAKASLEQLDAERDTEDERHAEAVAEIERKRKRIKAILKALGEEEPAPRRPRARSGDPGVYMPSAKTLVPLLEAVLGQTELFTALGIHNQLNARWSEPHTYVAFKFLHQREIIGKVRKEGGKQTRMLYRVLDREAGEALLRELKGPKEPVDA